ncbi:MAG TPA: hypothetical protein VES69_03155 [Pyrinomonadaceae bacterium]|nr:hypothetical protein [Pyrinomonadaceae bacterium]
MGSQTNIPARALIFISVLLTALSAFGQANQQRPPRTGEATIIVKEEFFNSFLDAIFDNLKAPSTPLVITDSDKNRTDESAKSCPSAITLQRENSGVKTAVKFELGKVVAPLAFSGAYNSTLLGCLQFRGVAYTEWTLEFDPSAQVLQARIKITDMRLENVPSLAQSSIVTLVQSAIDARINPLKILRPEQLSSVVPIAPSGGSIRLRAREVKPEIVPGLVHLHLTYEFLPEK